MRRWEDNIKIYLKEPGWGSANWIHLLQGKDSVDAVVNHRVP
jgi:hypothetical protein